MAKVETEVLFRDPELPWDGEFAYDRLRGVGVDSASSARQVNDALFDLMATPGGASPGDREAWDELRHLGRRLRADFFLYPLPSAGKGLPVLEGQKLPAPVVFPDLRALARVPVDFASLLTAEVPPPEETFPRAAPVLLDVSQIDVPPLDLGIPLRVPEITRTLPRNE